MIVADASIIANAVGDDNADGARARTALRVAVEVAAPDLVDVETVSVLRRRWMSGNLTAQRFRAAVLDLSDLAVRRYSVLLFVMRAYELRANVTPYDAAYIALAEALQCPLLTADARLAAAPRIRCEIRTIRP